MRASWLDHRAGQDTPVIERLISEITITDPAHAFYGRRFPLVSLQAMRGQGYLVFELPDGRHRTIRKASTDIGASAAQCHCLEDADLPRVSVRTLVPLAHHLRAKLITATMEVIRHASQPTFYPPACVALQSVGINNDECPPALAEPAASGPEPTGQPNGAIAVPREIASVQPAGGGMPC